MRRDAPGAWGKVPHGSRARYSHEDTHVPSLRFDAPRASGYYYRGTGTWKTFALVGGNEKTYGHSADCSPCDARIPRSPA